MEFTAREIAKMLDGVVVGNPDIRVSKVSKIEQGEPSSLSFLSNPRYTPYLYSTKASVVLVDNDFEAERPVSATLVKVDNAYQCFARLLEIYARLREEKKGIDPKACISPTAGIGKDAWVGPLASVGEHTVIGEGSKIHPGAGIGDSVTIGSNTVIHAGVRIYDDCVIGSHCTIHAGAVIGADGFGFAPQEDKNYKKVAQIGNVIIEDYVEVGANTTIDRATLGSTIIRKGVKLDNLIQVAHNVEIGENTVIAAQTGIAGSTRIGRNCMIGGQVGIIGHLTIADGVKIAAQSGVGSDISQPGAVVQGSPAYAIGDYKKSYVLFRKLPEMARELNELRRKAEAAAPKAYK